MSKFTMNPEEFMTISATAKVVDKDASDRYLKKVEEARVKMEELGFARLVDKKMGRKPPTLRRRIS